MYQKGLCRARACWLSGCCPPAACQALQVYLGTLWEKLQSRALQREKGKVQAGYLQGAFQSAEPKDKGHLEQPVLDVLQHGLL